MMRSSSNSNGERDRNHSVRSPRPSAALRGESHGGVVAGCRRAFTLVEVLVVIALVIILLSVLIVGLNIATGAAQKANTRSLMQAVNQGLVRFRTDVGYLPPVLDGGRPDDNAPEFGRVLHQPPGLDGSLRDYQEWYSVTTLAEYLLGYGHHHEDGYGYVADGGQGREWRDERPLLGFRHPRRDGVWGAGTGPLTARMGGAPYPLESSPGRFDQGKVYGPYIEVDDARLIGAINLDGEISFPGEEGYEEPNTEDPGSHAKVLCDYWGQPLQYFRRAYMPGQIKQSWRSRDNDGDGDIDGLDVPTLSRVVRLRPYGFLVGPVGLDGKEAPLPNVPSGFADANGDPTTTAELESAEYAIFSSGVDKTYDASVRMDQAELNADNIVETGQ